MDTQCLQPADLIQFLRDTAVAGAPPTTMCSLFLRLQALPTFGHLSAVEYLSRLGLSWMLEVPIYFVLVSKLRLRKAMEWAAGTNVVVHPLLFFGLPFLAALSNISMGLTLLYILATGVAARYLLMRNFSESPGWRVFCAVVLAQITTWWAGAVVAS